MRRVVIAVLVVLLGLTAGCTSGTANGPSSAGASPDGTAPAGSTPAGSSSETPTPSMTSRPDASSPPAPSSSSPAATNPEPPAPSSTIASSTVESSPPADSGFTSSIAAVDPALTVRMGSSWRAGCPVPLTDLRYLTLTYRDFDGSDREGELVVAASVADDVVAIFRRLYEIGYPIASMRLVDDFGGDDDASMSANNTSAFNCRPVTGGGGFSEHSYGTAIDVNPVQNPYLSGSTVLPAEGRAYVARPDSPGVIHAGDEVVQAFADGGFRWGGTWSGPIDYQHFSVSGR
jgi:hypothetical protein